jgi:hypothetical protein
MVTPPRAIFIFSQVLVRSSADIGGGAGSIGHRDRHFAAAPTYYL